MAQIQTYPRKTTYDVNDLILICDKTPDANGVVTNDTKTTTISTVVDNLNVVDTVTASGVGITASPNKGDVVIANTGVTSLVAGSNIDISGSTGAVTISTSAGVLGGSGTAYKIPMWSDSNTLTDSQFETASSGSGVLDIPNYIRHIGDTGNFFGFGAAGTLNEFLVYTEGSGSPLDQESLRIRPSGTAIKTNATTRLNTTVEGAIELYYAGSKRFETTDSGSTLTGGLSLSDGTNNVTISIPTITTSYDLKLPQIPTVAAGYTGGMGLKLPDTLGSSPFQLEWQQPNTKFKDVNSRPFIDGNLSGGISMQQSTGPTIKLEATTNSGSATTYLLPPASQSQAGYVLTMPTGTITSPYQLAWTSSVTSTNNVTASANSLNLQGSSSVAPTYGAPLNISSSGGSGTGAQTAIYIDQAATANVSGSQGVRMNFKTASIGILVTNADSQFSNVASFKNASNQVVGSISCTSSATTYATSSDYRIKENVVDMTGAVDRVKQLKPSRFNFTADPSKTVDGFLAHEAQEVVPESVTGVKDALYSNGDPLLQGIDQSKIVPLLTGAIKELIARIEVLEAK